MLPLPFLARRLLATSLLAAATTGAVAGGLVVRFVNPEKYTDASYSQPVATESDRNQVLRDVEQHLQRLTERGLPSGDTLAVDVLDIDLAGHFPPGGADVRVVTDVTGPRIRLRYTLSTNGQPPTPGGEEVLSDLNFMVPSNRYPSSDRLRYEKTLLDRWFAQRFGVR